MKRFYKAATLDAEGRVLLDGKPVNNFSELMHLLGPKYEGDAIDLVVERGGKEVKFDKVALGGTAPSVSLAFLGVLPMLLASEPRPPIVVLNVSFLFLDRPDDAPVGLGLPPLAGGVQERRQKLLGRKSGLPAAFAGPVLQGANELLALVGAGHA